MLDGAPVAALSASDQLRGAPIVVTDRRGDTWTTTVQEVVSRHDTEIVVTTSGRRRASVALQALKGCHAFTRPCRFASGDLLARLLEPVADEGQCR